MDYNALKPGLYLQVGDTLKTLQDGREYMGSFADVLLGNMTNPNLESLAAEVAWVYIALQRRKAQILEIDWGWELAENEIEVAPFGMKFRELIQQIDESMQIFSEAFLLKQRGRNGSVVGVRWLDPKTIEVDYDTADVMKGITRYWRHKAQGQKETLRGEDVIRFMIPGMRELRPAPSAARASSFAAQILYGISQTADVFYENNGLPVMLVKVPPYTLEPDKERLQDRFRRLFNQKKGTTNLRTAAVNKEIEVEPLSFRPRDLAQGELESSKIDEILAAHEVPKSIALANAANYATDVAAARRFVSAVGTRLEYIADVLNNDPDFSAAGYTLGVHVDQHFSMKEDEAQRAQAFHQYVVGGMSVEAAAWLVGVKAEDFPEDIDPFGTYDSALEPTPQPQPAALQQAQEQMMAPPASEGRMAEEKAYRRWLKKRERPDPDQFEAYHLTDEEKDYILWQTKGYTNSTAAPDDIGRSIRAFQAWADEHDPELALVLNLGVE